MRSSSSVATLLFLLALGVRLLYQHESVTRRPIQADAERYFFAAVNLRQHGSFSLERPSAAPPRQRTDIAPGYPLFLTLFLDASANRDVLTHRVRVTQAVLGASTAVFTFLLARTGLGTPWAALAGVLVALCPHLVVLDDCILTESLFTFLTMLGLVLVSMGWRREHHGLLFGGLVTLCIAAQTRIVGLLLPFAVVPLLGLHPATGALYRRPELARRAVLVLAAFLLLTGAHAWFVARTVTNTPLIQKEPERFTSVSHFERHLEKGWRPPRFAEREGIRVQRTRDWHQPTEFSFWDRPSLYLHWHLWYRTAVMWMWDQIYQADVYVYPMLRKGYETHPLLLGTHRVMRLSHWPMFVLAWLAVAMLAVRGWKRTLESSDRMLLLPGIAFVYSLLLLSIVGRWLPRYTIPVRPVAYILAVAALAWLSARLALGVQRRGQRRA